MKRCSAPTTHIIGLTLCLALLLSTALFAPSFTASVQDIVTDSSGALVPSAPITLLNEATNIQQSKESDDRDRCFFVLPPPGSCALTVEKPGFQTFWSPWTTSLDGGVTRYASVSNPYPAGVPQPTGAKLGLGTAVRGSMIADLRGRATKPCYQQWSLSIQRELPANSAAGIAYSANQGVHLWHVNGIPEHHSGLPLTTALPGGILPDSTQRPNLISDPGLTGSVESRLGRHLNPDAFSRPAPYKLCNAPRNLSSVRAPSFRNLDASIFDNLASTGDGKRYLQLRLEAFNAANTSIFGASFMNVGDTSFGVISSQANTPREIQVAVKIYF